MCGAGLPDQENRDQDGRGGERAERPAVAPAGVTGPNEGIGERAHAEGGCERAREVDAAGVPLRLVDEPSASTVPARSTLQRGRRPANGGRCAPQLRRRGRPRPTRRCSQGGDAAPRSGAWRSHDPPRTGRPELPGRRRRSRLDGRSQTAGRPGRFRLRTTGRPRSAGMLGCRESIECPTVTAVTDRLCGSLGGWSRG